MWVFYYANEEKIDMLYSDSSTKEPLEQIKETQKKQSIGVQAEVAGKFRLPGVFNIGSKLHANNGQYVLESVKEKYEGINYFEKANRIIEQMTIQNKICIISDENICSLKLSFNQVVRMSGHFKPLFNGKTYLQRLAEYNKSEVIIWEAWKCKKIITLSISRKYIKGNSPIHPAIKNEQGTLFFEVFGLIQENTDKTITIAPIFIGTEIPK